MPLLQGFGLSKVGRSASDFAVELNDVNDSLTFLEYFIGQTQRLSLRLSENMWNVLNKKILLGIKKQKPSCQAGDRWEIVDDKRTTGNTENLVYQLL